MTLTKSIKVLIFFSFLGLIILVLRSFENLNFSLITNLQLIFSYTLCISSIIIYCIKPKNFNYLPLLPLACLYFLICYISLFFFNYTENINYTHIEVLDIPKAIFILFLGISFFISGFHISKFFFKKFRRKEFKILAISEKENLIFGLILIIISIIFFYIIKIQIFFSFLAQIKFPILLLGYGLLTKSLLYQDKINKIFFCIILFKLLIIFLEILSGSFAFPFMLIFLDITYLFYIKKKINIFPIMLIGIFIIFLHLGKNQFRNFTWITTPEDPEKQIFITPDGISKKHVELALKNKIHISHRIGYLLQTYDVISDIDNSILNKTNSTHTMKRIFHSFESLVIVSKKSPYEIPFWDGYSYKILMSKIIPRVFWKEKPSDTLGNEFGHRYQILTKSGSFEDVNTSWNMPVLNEFYVNFGLKGVILGMFMLGILFNLVTIFFSIPNLKNVEHTINYYLFIPIFFMESHLSILTGALLQSYVFLLLFSFLSIISYRFVMGNK